MTFEVADQWSRLKSPFRVAEIEPEIICKAPIKGQSHPVDLVGKPGKPIMFHVVEESNLCTPLPATIFCRWGFRSYQNRARCPIVPSPQRHGMHQRNSIIIRLCSHATVRPDAMV